jgi:hypothetical protein
MSSGGKLSLSILSGRRRSSALLISPPISASRSASNVPRLPAAVELLKALKKVLGPRRIRWYLFGAQAVVYGSPRMTMDVDVTISVPEDRVRPLVAALLEGGFAARTDDLDAFFERSRVVPLVHKKTRMPLDLVVARDSLEATFLDRAKPIDVGGVVVPVISPEDSAH